MRPTYAIEIFKNAIELIGNKQGKNTNQLVKASNTIFRLSNSDIPNDILDDFNSLKNRLTSIKSSNANKGNIAMTLESISMQEYDAIILEINSFYMNLQSYRYSR